MTPLRLVLFSGLCCHAFAQTWNCTNVVDWNFFNSKVTQNNLGGVGPNLKDKQEIRYSDILAKGSSKVDLVVTIVKDKKYVPYIVNSNLRNGLNGQFGQMNIKNNHEFLFKFQMVEAGTDIPFKIEATDKIIFSVYDLDSDGQPGEHEYVLFTSGVASHSVNEPTTVQVSGQDGDGTLYAQSGRTGGGADNPTDPLAMTEIAEESKISVTYIGKSSWEMVFGHKKGWKNSGRNVLFAGRSQGDCACIGRAEWTLHENLKHNNLGGMGPVTTDPAELRYSKVFEAGLDRKPIDLVVKVADGSTYLPVNTDYNGLWPTLPDGKKDHNQMGQLNLKCGTNTTFDFMFVASGTNDLYNLSNVFFSVYDFDQHKGYVNHEYVVFPQPVTNWTLTQDPPTTVLKSGQNDGSLRFTSTIAGRVDDNPTDPAKLTRLQQSKSVTVWYSAASKFQVTLGHEYEQMDDPPQGGRNMLFAGPGIYCPAPKAATVAMFV